MKTYIEILKEIWNEKRKYLENYTEYCERLKKATTEILGESKLFLFGSIVKKNWKSSSDIDVLIVSDNLSSDWETRRIIKRKIKSQLPIFSPFQIHLATVKEYENWYKKFIKEDYEEI